jgi:hypothetical protein
MEGAMSTLNESTIRSRARRAGYVVCKSRKWKHVPHLDNYGKYQLVDAQTNLIVIGSRFEASLEDIAEFLGPDTV